ncbi:RCC1 domain protein [Pseudoloma neurophilia]|uniref:RCC1 domain protein n=1 Tax=Pseudoloma neurophilia TaxID=146866 RepID=A0A0R0LXP1_9MICR|nr:RCC1 domain protein [Pseudoloma neurophilia]
MTNNSNILTIGSNTHGQLGTGNNSTRSKEFVPVTFKSTKTKNSVSSLIQHDIFANKAACGAYHTIILTEKNEIYSWGTNANGSLGRTGDETVPGLVKLPVVPLNLNFVKKKGLLNITEEQNDYIIRIKCTEYASFALTEGGLLFGWGVFNDNTDQIGFFERKIVDEPDLKKKGSKNPSDVLANLKKGVLTPIDRPAKKPILIAKNVQRFSTGKNHVIYKTLEGIFSFGVNLHGERGYQPVKRKSQLEQLTPLLLVNKRSHLFKYDYLRCGSYTTFFVCGQEITAFGRNANGQLGMGDFNSGSMRRKIYITVETDKMVIEKEKNDSKNRVEMVEKIFHTEHNRELQKPKNQKQNVLLEKTNTNNFNEKVQEQKKDVKNFNLPDLSNEEIDLKVSDCHIRSLKSVTHETVVKIACGESHTILLTKLGNVYGIGSNTLQQLGTKLERKRIREPVLLANNIIDIKAKGFRSFFLSSDGLWHISGLNQNKIPNKAINELLLNQKDTEITDLQIGHDFIVILHKNH